jgi:hypothetical protein
MCHLILYCSLMSVWYTAVTEMIIQYCNHNDLRFYTLACVRARRLLNYKFRDLPGKQIFPQLVNKISNFIKPECSLSYSQELSAGSYPEPHESIPYSLYLFIYPSFLHYIPATAKSSKLFLSFRVLHENPVCISLLPHSLHIPSPFHHFFTWSP